MTDPGDYDGWTISIDAQWRKVTVRIPTEGTTECLFASISSTSIIVYSIGASNDTQTLAPSAIRYLQLAGLTLCEHP
jgi:hypothetical protein